MHRHQPREFRRGLPGEIARDPRDAVLLAQGADFETQAIRVGRAAYGFQFHPEVTYAMMCRWTCRGAERMSLPGARERREHLEGWFLHDQKVARGTSDFLACWLKAGTRADCASAA